MKIFLGILTFVFSSMVNAAEPALTKQYEKCLDEDDTGGPIARIECMVSETKRQGALLEVVYKKVLKHTPKEQQPKLREAQRDWLKFLASNCDAFYDAGESIGAMLAREEERASCVMKLTRDRKENLKDLLDIRAI